VKGRGEGRQARWNNFMNRFLCIHGHFYQPPRENPWLEAVEVQDSAAPYHDWNERVLAECYAPNAVSRILDEKGYIRKIVNNYSNISFDFGPTLLSWLEEKAEAVYQAVLMADWESIQRFSGHGSAMAQAYSHMVLPLADRRDKITQVEWGLRDFESRFRRPAEGMWLPETAVDLETLDGMAERGIRFTILAPHQALRIRPAEGGGWQEVPAGAVDITRAYEVDLPSGRTIAVFFYHDAIARAVSFEGLLSSGDAFAKRLLDAFPAGNSDPQLVHVATDGESYGHHHRFGDMALAYALDKVEAGGQAALTNYGEFLAKNPPRWKVQIAENTSWSCSHGVERWRSDCGCNTGQHPEWNQAWRAPLRGALDSLRDELAPLFEREAARFFRDPWAARNEYVAVVLDRSEESLEKFFRTVQSRPLSEEERTRALKLLEMQRHAMLMFTSCGWFFDDLAGIESLQNLQYAARAVQLAQELFGDGGEERFLGRLREAVGNEKGKPDGGAVYGRIRTARVDLPQVAAHYAVASIFESYGDRTRISCYRVERHKQRIFEAGRAKLAVGLVTVTSEITREHARLCYGMLHFGDHNFSGGVCPCRSDGEFSALETDLSTSFLRGDFPEAIRFIDTYFGGVAYSLVSLFLDEQRKILNLVIQENLADAEAVYSQLYENHAPLMRFLQMLKMPLPKAFQAAAVVAVNGRLRDAFSSPTLDVDYIHRLLEQAEAADIELDGEALGFTLRNTINRLAADWYTEPEEPARLQILQQAVDLARSLPFWVDLWKAQNVYYEILQNTYPRMRDRTRENQDGGPDWTKEFLDLGELLRVRTGGAEADERTG
jgi:alpha-amylase/alpha-mannosidase (GH57 family)